MSVGTPSPMPLPQYGDNTGGEGLGACSLGIIGAARLAFRLDCSHTQSVGSSAASSLLAR